MIIEPTIGEIVFYGVVGIVGLIILIVANARKDKPRVDKNRHDPYRYCPKQEDM